MNKLPWFTHDNDAHQDLKLRHVMREHGGLKVYGLWWVLVEVLDLHGGGDFVSVPLADLETMTMSKREYILKAAQALAVADLIQIQESAPGLFNYEINKFRERQSKLKSKVRSFPSKTPVEGDVDVDLEKRERNGHGSADALNSTQSAKAENEFGDDDAIWLPYPKENGFNEFWSLYPTPNVKDKPQAFEVWKEINPSCRWVGEILGAIRRAKETDAWQKDKGRHVPNPSQWLREEFCPV